MPCPAIWRKLLTATLYLALFAVVPGMAQPFTVQGPGVNPGDFRVTVFASGLDFPLSMAELPDGSILAAVHQGGSYFSASGKLIRLTDTNQNGIADSPGTVLYSGLPSLTAVRRAGNLVIATGQAKPFFVLRTGVQPSDPLTLVGQMGIAYPPNPGHPHSALTVRKTPGFTNRYDLLFQLGCEYNFTVSTNLLALTNSNIPGATGILAGDALHMITLIDNLTNVTATNLVQVGSGLRNPAGLAFHPVTGDLYLQDNGIDGLVNGNEPHSADELNVIARTNLGTSLQFFGFPANYTAYRTNTFVGGAGIPPLIAFQPIPNPFTGRESEGANDIAMAPPGFPDGLNSGVFLGFHGRFNSGGTANEENPLVYADAATGNYFHFIQGQQTGIGHLDGLLATRDSLFVADLVTTGSMNSGTGAGVIYQIKSLVTPSLPILTIHPHGADLKLTWNRGMLQEAANLAGPWTEVPEAFSPLSLSTTATQKFYRTVY